MHRREQEGNSDRRRMIPMEMSRYFTSTNELMNTMLEQLHGDHGLTFIVTVALDGSQLQ